MIIAIYDFESLFFLSLSTPYGFYSLGSSLDFTSITSLKSEFFTLDFYPSMVRGLCVDGTIV